VAGHESPEVDRLVQERDGFSVVEKPEVPA